MTLLALVEMTLLALVEMTLLALVEMTLLALIEITFHSKLKSFHSGFMVITNVFFFSLRHFLISFSLAMAA